MRTNTGAQASSVYDVRVESSSASFMGFHVWNYQCREVTWVGSSLIMYGCEMETTEGALTFDVFSRTLGPGDCVYVAERDLASHVDSETTSEHPVIPGLETPTQSLGEVVMEHTSRLFDIAQGHGIDTEPGKL